MYIVWADGAYLVISLSITLWVTRALHRNGRIFLVAAFSGNAELTDSVNYLLVLGFCLVNFGYLALTLSTNAIPGNSRQAIEFVSDRIGAGLLVLGGTLFFNLYIFSRMRRK